MGNSENDPDSAFYAPAGQRNADIEQAHLEATGRRLAQLRAHGICSHGWWQVKPGGSVVCLDCAATFATEDSHWTARKAVLR